MVYLFIIYYLFSVNIKPPRHRFGFSLAWGWQYVTYHSLCLSLSSLEPNITYSGIFCVLILYVKSLVLKKEVLNLMSVLISLCGLICMHFLFQLARFIVFKNKLTSEYCINNIETPNCSCKSMDGV